MSTHNKNAYEIRLEVLKMAHDDFMGKYHQKIESERNQFNSDGEVVPKTVSHETIDELFPKTSEVLDRAEELYKFVCQN